MIYDLCNLIGLPHTQTEAPNGRWVRAVPSPYPGGRLRAAWAVLRGRAVAVRWPQPGDLERALEDRT